MLSGTGLEHHGEILASAAALADEGKLKPLLNPAHFSTSNIDAAHAIVESGCYLFSRFGRPSSLWPSRLLLSSCSARRPLSIALVRPPRFRAAHLSILPEPKTLAHPRCKGPT
jgi:hypothetical protein